MSMKLKVAPAPHGIRALHMETGQVGQAIDADGKAYPDAVLLLRTQLGELEVGGLVSLSNGFALSPQVAMGYRVEVVRQGELLIRE